MPYLNTFRRFAVAATMLALVALPVPALAQDTETSPVPATSAVEAGPAGTWQVVAFDPWGEGLIEPLPGSTMTVGLLGDGRLQGETGCGRYNGGWALDDEVLGLAISPTGYFGCGDAETEEAIGFSVAIDAVVGWSATDSGIELFDVAGTPRLVLQPVVVAEPTGAWTVARYRRPNGVMTEPLPGRPMSLELADVGVVSGSTGCRLLEGEYFRDGSTIIIGPVETVGLPCEGDDRKAERQLLRALGDVIYWVRSGDTLSLNDGFDELLVELVTAADPAPSAVPDEPE